MHLDRTAARVPTADSVDGGHLAHLAQVLAHRLRSLVAGIEGYTDLLVDTLDTTDQRELAMKILEGTARIESILADLQLYGERREPALLSIHLGEMMRDLVAPLTREDAARVEVVTQPEASGVVLRADPFLLRQALLVLLQNALEATPDQSSIKVDARLVDGFVCVDVWNGGTIDVDSAETEVFVPFYTTKAQNLGVGLSMARRIATLHNGRLELTSNSRLDGVCFTFSLPHPDAAAHI